MSLLGYPGGPSWQAILTLMGQSLTPSSGDESTDNDTIIGLLQAILALLEADKFINTATVPWQEVSVEAGTGGLSGGTILLSKRLFDTSQLPVTTPNAVIGAKTS